MMNLLRKECKLSASPLSYFFLAASFLTFLPGYPILLGSFFATLGIFYSFQAMRENNDLGYSLLLPLSKADIVKGKFAFVMLLELLSFLLTAAVTLCRMTVFRDAPVYLGNALMGANFVFLGESLLLFGLFNLLFVGGFFKTGYYFGKPFLCYCVAGVLLITAAEALWHIPGLECFNAFGWDQMPLQLAAFAVGIACFVILTATSLSISIRRMERIDL